MTAERPERRARTVAWVGLVYSIVLVLVYGLLYLGSGSEVLPTGQKVANAGSEAICALAYLAGASIPIWFVLLLICHQRVRVQAEAFETEQLRREQQTGGGDRAIFDVDDEQLLLAKRRLAWMYRWVLPAFSVGIIIALVSSFFQTQSVWQLIRSAAPEERQEVQHASLLAWFLGGSAFLTFLLSRYVTGMARHAEWRMLRAGASYLMGLTLASTAVTGALGGLIFFETQTPERVVAYVLQILMLVLAVEFGLNFVLDFYRPRTPEEEPRPAFDSRVFGLFTEPGGIARSLADAVNYQFGFEVSSTWFYSLLERSVVPLIGFTLATLVGASSLVFVEAEERGVVAHLGAKGRVLEPGLHLKWPWPIDSVTKVPVSRIHVLKIGTLADHGPEEQKTDELLLWTNEHDEPHLNVLVATPTLAEGRTGDDSATQPASGLAEAASSGIGGETGEAVAVSMLRVAVALQYTIDPDRAYDWVAAYEDPEKAMKATTTREITRFCAGIDMDRLMGSQRAAIEKTLHEKIQTEFRNKLGLPVEIVFFGLQGVHPPVETAKVFQAVIGAEQEATAAIEDAKTEKTKRLSEVAGTVARAMELHDAIDELTRLNRSSESNEADRRAAGARVDTLLMGDAETDLPPVGGEAAIKILEARAKRWRLENQARARVAAFDAERRTRDAAPEVYRARKYLEAMARSMDEIRKYVIGTSSEGDDLILQLNLQDSSTAPIGDDIKAAK